MTIALKKIWVEVAGQNSSFKEESIFHAKKKIGRVRLFKIDLHGWHCKNCLLQFVDGHSASAFQICHALCDEDAPKFKIVCRKQGSAAAVVRKFVIVDEIETTTSFDDHHIVPMTLDAIAAREFADGVDAIFFSQDEVSSDVSAANVMSLCRDGLEISARLNPRHALKAVGF